MPARDARACAYCRARAADARWFPFCSERCRLLDLADWMDGKYRVGGEPVTLETDSPDAPEADG